ncbi:MAG: thiaminase II [Deferribacteraceae bacterium]|jgi:thiaminase/transcriptional activator TenA|nr:thiaminase II [Deferribacteraceae bacterium]
MNLSELSWQQIKPIYSKIIEHPFVTELMNGTLAEEKFVFYIQQDALYLAEYGRILAAIAAKLSDSAHSEAFLSFAKDSIAVERELHATYLKDNTTNIEPSPSCMLYTSYLWTQIQTAPIEVSVAAVLPCFWIYKEVGEYILANQTESDNRYQAWIDTYGGTEFAEAVKMAINIYDELAKNATEAQRQQMIQAFTICSKMEWIFWDSAYRLEQWAV